MSTPTQQPGQQPGQQSRKPLLVVDKLAVSFNLPKPHVWSPRRNATVLRDISFTLEPGETLGIVGESGSGKTTLGRTIMRISKPTGGRLVFDGVDITSATPGELRVMRDKMQMIFQDPQSSLNPRRRIKHIVTQPMAAFGQLSHNSSTDELAFELLERVGLDPALSNRYPHELSGGQRQRIGIARAISLNPKLIIADEIVSGLDVSSQAQILSLLAELKNDLGLALVFISHDLSVVRKLCDRTLVLQHGRVAELNQTGQLFKFARHPYTRELIRAIPLPVVETEWFTEQNTLSKGGLAMQINGATALVTGANRGIGQHFVQELVRRGAKKVYATARDARSLSKVSGNVEIQALDITDHAAIAALAAKLGDVDLLVNNAGVNRMSSFAATDTLDAARDEMEVNYFGTLAMCRAFAPVLKANGGGGIINLLSILARVNLPLMGSLCASKAAGLSLVQGLRAELAAQHTSVVAIMPGAVDTDMSKDFPPPKMAPADVAIAALDGLEQGLEEVYPGDMASGMNQGLAADPKAVEKELAGYLPS